MSILGPQEEMVAALEASGNYRILRRLTPRARYTEEDGTAKRIGIILDVETTGLDPTRDEVIELAMVKFEFDSDGRIFSVLDSFDELRQPSVPIPPEITRLTGIADVDVAGRSIDSEDVSRFIADAAVVIAHNAAFDRKFAERSWPEFEHKAWACSVSQIDWRSEGFEGSRLGYLLAGCGLFHDAHRADADCAALIEILSRPLPASGEPALKRLLDTARQATVRVWATNSPFDLKDALKSRGYRWNDGSDARPKAWWIDVPEDQLEIERHFLATEIYGWEADVPTRRITAFDRFSERV